MKKISKKTILLSSCLIVGFSVYALAQPASMQPNYRAMEVYVPINGKEIFTPATPIYEGNIAEKIEYKINDQGYGVAPTMPVEAIKVIRSEKPKTETKRKYFLDEKQVPLSPNSPVPPSMRIKRGNASFNKVDNLEIKIQDEVLLSSNSEEIFSDSKNNSNQNDSSENIGLNFEVETNEIEIKKKTTDAEIKKKSNLDNSSSFIKNIFFQGNLLENLPKIEVASADENFVLAQVINLREELENSRGLQPQSLSNNLNRRQINNTPRRTSANDPTSRNWKPIQPSGNRGGVANVVPQSNDISVNVKPITINNNATEVEKEPLNNGLMEMENVIVEDKKIMPSTENQILPIETQPEIKEENLEVRRPVNKNIPNFQATQPENNLSNAKVSQPQNISLVAPNLKFENSFMNVGNSGINGVMEEYLSKAYIENPQLKALRNAIKASDEAMPQAISGFLPRVDLNFSEAVTNGSDGTNQAETFTPSSQSLDVRQNLFAGLQSIYQIKSAKDRIISARFELKNEEQNFLRQAVETYVNLIFAKKVLSLNQKNEKVLSDQVKSTRDRFVIGDATRTDVAQSEARLANAVSSRITAENEFVNAKSQFRRIFLVDAPENLSMPTKLPNIPANLDEALNTAINKNPEIQRNLYAKNQRVNEIEVQRSQLFPQLDLTGSISKREAVNSNNLFNNEQESIGLNLRVPLYDSGVAFSRTREAKDRKNQSEFEYQNSVITTRDTVIRAWQALATATLNIEATKASILAAEYAIDGVREEQKEGQRTVFDVLLAEQDRFNAEVAHARAIRDSILAVYNLKAAVGQLNPSELNLAVSEYNPEEHYEKTKLKFIGF